VIVFERGVGLTQACGTGACAAVVVHARKGRAPFDEWVPVQLPGGVLEINARKDLSQVLLRGPATRVFEGER
jgi:diaminopimelate epimerase